MIEKLRNYFLAKTLYVLVHRYCVYVEHPFVGYRLQPKYAHLLPTCTGRPRTYSLSALYTEDGIEGYVLAKEQAAENKKYPGSH